MVLNSSGVTRRTFRLGTKFIPVLMLAGCAGPLSTLDPAGPPARMIAMLWWALLIGAAAISTLVGALTMWAWRRRDRETPVSPKRWIVGGGIVFPLVTLAVLTGFAFWVGERLLPHPAADVVTVEARGHRFWWAFTQPGPDGAPVHSATELHIPAGRPVDVRIESADVIHSFWVPRLAGKMDAIPGHVNVLRLRADRPGIYEGKCAEYCGFGHSRNAFVVVAHAPEDYARALVARTVGPPPSAGFRRHCAACHSLDPRVPSAGPNLAGVIGRPWPSTHQLRGLQTASLAAWLQTHVPAVPRDEVDALLPYAGAGR